MGEQLYLVELDVYYWPITAASKLPQLAKSRVLPNMKTSTNRSVLFGGS